ncbi:MAG: GNAT family N-acetyltransferase [Nocardioidaceae bacterium]|nr:GNAT family N-acetyltransferase [Nocardioidaceae bacterium]
MTPRYVGADDWAQWRDLRLRALADSPDAFGSTLAREEALTEAHWRARLGDPDGVAVLVDVDGHPVGMGAGFPDLPGLLHVVTMWVEPACRGRGVGGVVLRAVENWATARGLGLHLDVNVANPVARSTYERYGFVGTGETRPLRDGSAQRIERMVLHRTS